MRPTVILTTTVANQQIVKRCCAVAHATGVREGMSVALAKALAPYSIIAPFDPLRDFRALYKLALYCSKFTPLTGIDAELFEAFQQNRLEEAERSHTGIILNITGTERLHQGEAALAQRVATLFTERKIAARLAIASTIGAAWALSRCSRELITIMPSAAHTKKSVSALPLAALRLEPRIEEKMRELGLTTTGMVLTMPSKTLGTRFGTHTLRRIHQLLGAIEESFVALSPKTPPTLSRAFDIPLMRKEAVQYTILGLLDKLFLTLSLHGVRARSFIIRIEGLDGNRTTQIFTKEIALNTVTRDLSKLRGTITPIIDELSFQEGVAKITIAAQSIERLLAEQEDFLQSSERGRTTEAGGELLNSLSIRLGPERVKMARFKESYLPERSFSYHPIPYNYIKLVKESPQTTTLLLPDRPPYLLESPEAAAAIALLPDHPPARITWRGAQHEIIAGIGPERVLPEWWRDQGAENESITMAERDYFKLQNKEGLWLWVFRNQRTHSWWVHGMWV